ncbi:hypothetical protein DV515_00000113 [Chloebia gouldiae]|uniref:Uncharacterized protein n=1 Tax=Chloebia gouldiae TaxID=44316 RepID=A0A3L8T0T4_CHLGU|nr:hypothetical protein DV515_00000113 [Chloebia gouldiae]
MAQAEKRSRRGLGSGEEILGFVTSSEEILGFVTSSEVFGPPDKLPACSRESELAMVTLLLLEDWQPLCDQLVVDNSQEMEEGCPYSRWAVLIPCKASLHATKHQPEQLSAWWQCQNATEGTEPGLGKYICKPFCLETTNDCNTISKAGNFVQYQIQLLSDKIIIAFTRVHVGSYALTLILSSHCQPLSPCALSGTGRWAATVKGDEMEEAVVAAAAAKSLLCQGQPLSPGLASQAVSSRELAARSILWASVQLCVASWPALCQSSKRLGANNGAIQALELQLWCCAGISCIKMSDCNSLCEFLYFPNVPYMLEATEAPTKSKGSSCKLSSVWGQQQQRLLLCHKLSCIELWKLKAILGQTHFGISFERMEQTFLLSIKTDLGKTTILPKTQFKMETISEEWILVCSPVEASRRTFIKKKKLQSSVEEEEETVCHRRVSAKEETVRKSDKKKYLSIFVKVEKIKDIEQNPGNSLEAKCYNKYFGFVNQDSRRKYDLKIKLINCSLNINDFLKKKVSGASYQEQISSNIPGVAMAPLHAVCDPVPQETKVLSKVYRTGFWLTLKFYLEVMCYIIIEDFINMVKYHEESIMSFSIYSLLMDLCIKYVVRAEKCTIMYAEKKKPAQSHSQQFIFLVMDGSSYSLFYLYLPCVTEAWPISLSSPANITVSKYSELGVRMGMENWEWKTGNGDGNWELIMGTGKKELGIGNWAPQKDKLIVLHQDKSSVTFLLLNFQNFILPAFEDTNIDSDDDMPIFGIVVQKVQRICRAFQYPYSLQHFQYDCRSFTKENYLYSRRIVDLGCSREDVMKEVEYHNHLVVGYFANNRIFKCSVRLAGLMTGWLNG